MWREGGEDITEIAYREKIYNKVSKQRIGGETESGSDGG